MTTTTTAPPPGTVRVDREPTTRVAVVIMPCDQLPSQRERDAQGWTRGFIPCDGCGQDLAVAEQCAECMGRYCGPCEAGHEHLRYDLAKGRAPRRGYRL